MADSRRDVDGRVNISRILTEVVHVVDSRGDVDGRVEHLTDTDRGSACG